MSEEEKAIMKLIAFLFEAVFDLGKDLYRLISLQMESRSCSIVYELVNIC